MEHLSKFKLGIAKRSSFKITIHFLSFECLFIIYIRVTKKVTKLGFVEYSCMPSGFIRLTNYIFKRKISSWFLWL